MVLYIRANVATSHLFLLGYKIRKSIKCILRACRVTESGGRPVLASNPRSPMGTSWVEKPLVFLVSLGVWTRILPQEHLMQEQGHATPGVCPETSENGATVSIYGDARQPLLQLKRALPWAALCEVRSGYPLKAGHLVASTG
jgi:hypothetical protein